jgi:predicted dehydrogenase
MAAIGTGANRSFRPGPDVPTRGGRGIAILQNAMREVGVQVTAVCDVDRRNAEVAQRLVRDAAQGGSRDCRMHGDFRSVLEDRDITAVLIGTPDHWHALIALAALRAGKDVYCEKPMTLTVAEARALARVARETGRVFQVGTQQRTEFQGRFRLAAELVRNGRLGAVRRITTLVGANPTGGAVPGRTRPRGARLGFLAGPGAAGRVHARPLSARLPVVVRVYGGQNDRLGRPP